MYAPKTGVDAKSEITVASVVNPLSAVMVAPVYDTEVVVIAVTTDEATLMLAGTTVPAAIVSVRSVLLPFTKPSKVTTPADCEATYKAPAAAFVAVSTARAAVVTVAA